MVLKFACVCEEARATKAFAVMQKLTSGQPELRCTSFSLGSQQTRQDCSGDNKRMVGRVADRKTGVMCSEAMSVLCNLNLAVQVLTECSASWGHSSSPRYVLHSFAHWALQCSAYRGSPVGADVIDPDFMHVQYLVPEFARRSNPKMLADVITPYHT